jgi:hypothetical protein
MYHKRNPWIGVRYGGYACKSGTWEAATGRACLKGKKKIRKENKSMSKSLAQPLKGPVAINFESTNP